MYQEIHLSMGLGGTLLIKVFLLSTIQPEHQDTHWASPYYVLKESFLKSCSNFCEIVYSPDKADLIIICPRLRNPVFPIEIFRDGIAWEYRKKTIVLSTDDSPFRTHKGFYTSLHASLNRSDLFKGGFYPLVSCREPKNSFSLTVNFPYLFSFLGSFKTHPVRKEIGLLNEDVNFVKFTKSGLCQYLVKDTENLQKELSVSSNDQTLFKKNYLDSMRDSKFILCPRGRSPSSVRLFESMKAGRVPVVISDEWVPPPEIPWNDFVIIVKEKDIRNIPEILISEEGDFAERATVARKVWDQYFSIDVLPETITKWGLALLEESRRTSSYIHLYEIFKQLVSWNFVRRGIISELKRTFS